MAEHERIMGKVKFSLDEVIANMPWTKTPTAMPLAAPNPSGQEKIKT
jgi:hypothetical protein